jgi:hypothetical protein
VQRVDRSIVEMSSRGQALAEFALVFPLFLLIVFGVVDFGRVVYAYNTLSNASRAGVRLAIVDQNSIMIVDRARATALGMPPSEVAVDVPAPACTKIGCEIAVTVSYDWTAVTPIVGNVVGPISLSSTTSMPIERVFNSSP